MKTACSTLITVLCTVFLLLCGPTGIKADTATLIIPGKVSDELVLRKTIIDREKESLEKIKKDIEAQKRNRDKKLAALQATPVTDALLEEARLSMEAAKVNVESARLDLGSEKHRIQALQSQLENIQNRLPSPGHKQGNQAQATKLEEKLKELQALINIEQQYSNLLAQRVSLLEQKADLAASWWQSVQAVFKKQQQRRHQESIEDMKRRLEHMEDKARIDTMRIEKELSEIKGDDPGSTAKKQFLKRQLEFIDESLNILRTKIRIQSMKSRHDSLVLTGLANVPAEKLKNTIEVLKDIRSQLAPMIGVTRGKLEVLQKQWALLQKQYALKNISSSLFTREKKIVTGLIDQFSSLLNTMKAFQTQIQQDIQKVESAYARSVQQSLTAHENLPRDINAWKGILTELYKLPSRLKGIFLDIGKDIVCGWKQADTGHRLLFIGISILLLIITLLLGRLPDINQIPPSLELRFSARVKATAYALLRQCRMAMLIGGEVIVAAWLFNVEPMRFTILLLFVLVLFALWAAINLSYLIFTSKIVPAAQRQPKMHHMIIFGSVISAVLAILMGLGNAGILSDTLKDVVDRLFMVLLLLSVYFFMRLRAMLIARLGPDHKSRFWIHIIGLASLSIPLTALCAAIVGLAGYINLARFVASQLVIVLGVIITWILIRDVARDLIRYRKLKLESANIQSDTSRSSFMASLQRLLDLLLFAGVLYTLARIYGWNTGNAVDTFLKSWLDYPLFHIGKQTITLINILISLFLFLFFMHLSSLARNVTYMLMKKNVSDRGLRNSLSIFTQYAVLIIGAMIALNSMGLNLTSLTVFAGALGVGIGFGLQNIANNLISGLILLAERPVRVDDWISIGENQGIISHIGMRSLMLKTWDNQDVIIPNADVITTPVTNWTLSDNLIRTVLQVGIRYQDDPHKAQEVIMDAVSMVPEVSLQKKPKVYLTEFADSSVNFKVVFYSELDSQHSKLEAKSNVMFAIWDALKDADIGIPFPQQDIYIKEIPAHMTSCKQAAAEPDLAVAEEDAPRSDITAITT